MKTLTVLFAVITCASISWTSLSQSDPDCYRARWISVTDQEQNKELFQGLSEVLAEIKKQTDNNILFGRSEHNENGPMVDEHGEYITQKVDDGPLEFVYPDKTVELVQSDSPLINEFGYPLIELNDDGTEGYVYPAPVITSVHSDVPLTDENGEPVVQQLDDGTNVFVYPMQYDFSIQEKRETINNKTGEIVIFDYGEHVYSSIDEYAISELYMIEISPFDFEKNEFTGEMKVSRIALCMNTSPTTQQRLFIDADEFFGNMKKPEENPWYSIVKERNYNGYAFKEVPCDD